MLPRSLILIVNIILCSDFGTHQQNHTVNKKNDLNSVILNSHSEPVPYAHLYLADSETGTVSGFNGEFSIPDNWPDSGTVVISAIGYRNKSLSVAELRTRLAQNVPVILSSKNYGLGELTVSASRLKSGTVRNYGFLQRVLRYGGSVGGFAPPENRVAYSRAQRIDIDRDPPYWLNSVTIWVDVDKSTAFRNPENRETDESEFSKEALIRISLVDLAEDGSPGANSYLPEPIYLLLDGSGSRQEIDLSDYTLKMSVSQFYIVAEFILDDPDFYNGYIPMFTAGEKGDGSYYRRSPFRPWIEDRLLDDLQMMYKAEYLY